MSYFFVFIIFVSLCCYFFSKKKDPVESTAIPLSSQQGGGRFDLVNLTFPFVRHTYYDHFIVISFFLKTYVLRYSDILFVNIKYRPLYNGFHFKHSRGDLPESIIIWSFSPSKTKSILEYKGVAIKD